MRFQWIKSPSSEELAKLSQTIAKLIARFLERRGLLVCDAGHSYLSSSVVDDEYDPMHQLHGSLVTYRIAVGLRQRCNVFTLQTLPARDPEEWGGMGEGRSKSMQ
jgi:hypothetical protein